VSTEALANGNALELILIRICIYQFRNRLDSLTLSNAGAVTFQTCCNKVGARDLLDCIVVPVTRNRYSYLLLLLFVLIRQFSVIHSVLFIVRLLLHFH
jgi:hypothetical protein